MFPLKFENIVPYLNSLWCSQVYFGNPGPGPITPISSSWENSGTGEGQFHHSKFLCLINGIWLSKGKLVCL